MRPLLPTAALIAATLIVSTGCANPWAHHYRGLRTSSPLPPLPAGAPVAVERVSFDEALTIKDRDGHRFLGRSWFFDDRAHDEARAVAFARSIGATLVVWGRDDPITSRRTVTTRMPITEHTRTTGAITTPGGTPQHVDLRTTTTRWEDVTTERTESRHPHAAAFFAPAFPPPH